jgi:hypothetical protein
MITAETITAVLAEVAKAAEGATWFEVESPGPDSKAFKAYSRNWNLLVISFDIESQGFPPGSRGYDGTAAGNDTVIRLTRELAEKLYREAANGV